MSKRRGGIHPLAVVLVVLVGAAVGRWYYLGIHPNVFPKRFGVVQEGAIYRSGKITPAAMRTVVRRHGIRTVVDLGAYEEGSREDVRYQRTAESLGVDRVRFPGLFGDATGNMNWYVRTLEVMNDPERWPVLVHCGAGTERTGCAVIMYKRVNGLAGYDEAMAEAIRYGHSPSRNPWLPIVLNDWAWHIERAYREGAQIASFEPVPELEALLPPADAGERQSQ